MTNQIRVVTLENLEPRLACYNLNHDEGHVVARVFPRVLSLPNGQQHGEFVTRSLPDSVTFLAKEIRTVPASFLGCDEIKHALRPEDGAKPRLRQRGDVVAQDVSESAPAAAPSNDAPAEVVSATQKKARDAARQVTSSQATADEKKD